MKNSLLPSVIDVSEHSIIPTPKRSFLDSGVVGRIDRKAIFHAVHYNKPIPYRSFKNETGKLDQKKYITYAAINKDRLHNTIRDIKNDLDTHAPDYFNTTQALNSIETAINDLQFDVARKLLNKVLDTTSQQGIDSLHGTINHYAKQVLLYTTEYQSAQEKLCINSKVDASKVVQALSGGDASKVVLFLAQYVHVLDKAELSIIIHQLNIYVSDALQQWYFLRALNTLDQLDYFQTTYHDIGFRFSLDASSIPDLFKPEIFSQIGLHPNKESFIARIKELFASQKTLCDKLVAQAEQHYNADNFYYWRAMSWQRSYEAKQDYIEFIKQQNNNQIASDIRQTLSANNKGWSRANIWKTLGF